MIHTAGRRSAVVLVATALAGAAALAGQAWQAHADGPVWGNGRMHAAPRHHRTPPHKPHKPHKPNKPHKPPRSHGANRPGVALTRPAHVQVSTNAPGVAILPGRTYSWPYAVTNASPTKAGQVVFSAPLPKSMEFVSAEQNCVWRGGAAVCGIGTLQPGETKAGVITARVPAQTAPGTEISSPAMVRWDSSQSTTHFPPVRVAHTADVAVAESSVKKIKPGPFVPFDVLVTNNGPSEAENVVLRETAKTHFGNGQSEVPQIYAGSACLLATFATRQMGASLVCNLGTIKVGETRTVHLKVIPGPDYKPGKFRPGTAIEVPSEVASPTMDTNLANNHAIATTKVMPGVPLAGPATRKGRQIIHQGQFRPGSAYAQGRGGVGTGNGHLPGGGGGPVRGHGGLPYTGAPVTTMLHGVAALLGAGLILYRLGRPRRRRRFA
jgi:uncharacterized repeat protein (TIGR01451 family)